MITERDLQQAIAECQAERNPNAQTCIKLAAYYTIQQHLNPVESYSYAPPSGVHIGSGSEFAEAVEGKTPEEAWAVMDELMGTLKEMVPRLYASVMRRFEN